MTVVEADDARKGRWDAMSCKEGQRGKEMSLAGPYREEMTLYGLDARQGFPARKAVMTSACERLRAGKCGCKPDY
jgi:hypothetical protein